MPVIPRDNHIMVVGAGVVGVACAHYLSKAGYRVTLVDQGAVGAGCSHANCGYVCPSHVLPLTEPAALLDGMKSLLNPKAPFRIKPSIRPALWRWMFEFAKRCTHKTMLNGAGHLKSILDSSMQEYRQLAGTGDVQCEWSENGLLYVFEHEAAKQGFGQTTDMIAQQFGVRCESFDGDALSEFDPAIKQGLAGGFYYPHDASLKPDVLIQSWVKQLRDNGVTIIENCRIEHIEKSHNAIASLSSGVGQQLPHADGYVFATGAWSTQLSKTLECPIPIEAGKGYSITMNRPSVCPTHPMLFPEKKIGVTPFADGFRLGSMMEFSGYDSTIPEARIQQLKDAASPYLVEPTTEVTQERWYGWRPMTWDSLPIIGQLPRFANGFLATGHNMLGVSLAPVTGKLIAEIIQGREPHVDISPYTPTRFA